MKIKRFFTVILVLFIAGCETIEFEDSVNPYLNKRGTYVLLGSNNGNNFQFTNRERYNEYEENPFIQVSENPISTFSIDADGASYSNIRRFLNDGKLPPKDAVRTEELINYFIFDYPEPTDGYAISINGEVSICPWEQSNKLIRIGIKGKTIPKESLPPSNIVLLIDVSGSMSSQNKLDLLKESFVLFVNELDFRDKLAIVTYAGVAGVALTSTNGSEKETIINVINNLEAGGSTAGAQGIITAYEIAQENFVEGGNNRVILATDGDFNVGPSSQEELVELIESKRDYGIFLTVLGVGTGNLNDAAMEQIANNGNGNYEYIDNIEQAEKVLVHEFNKFFTVAKDVKFQITFNPYLVEAYRLIGYENRLLDQEDFEDDEKDAGEIGSGQAITALYEIIPVNNTNYTGITTIEIDLRFKNPDEDVSKIIQLDIVDQNNSFDLASESLRFAASVTGFAMLLRDSPYKGNTDYDKILNWTESSISFNPHNYKDGFIELVNLAKNME